MRSAPGGATRARATGALGLRLASPDRSSRTARVCRNPGGTVSPTGPAPGPSHTTANEMATGVPAELATDGTLAVSAGLRESARAAVRRSRNTGRQRRLSARRGRAGQALRRVRVLRASSRVDSRASESAARPAAEALQPALDVVLAVRLLRRPLGSARAALALERVPLVRAQDGARRASARTSTAALSEVTTIRSAGRAAASTSSRISVSASSPARRHAQA